MEEKKKIEVGEEDKTYIEAIKNITATEIAESIYRILKDAIPEELQDNKDIEKAKDKLTDIIVRFKEIRHIEIMNLLEM